MDPKKLPFILVPALLVVVAVAVVLITTLAKPKDTIPEDPQINHTHSYGEWISEVTPTCEKSGTKGHYHCSCGKDFDADHNELSSLYIPKAHTLGSWIAEVPPTCEQNGQAGHYQCSTCQKYFDNEQKELTDLATPPMHTLSAWTAEIPATGNIAGTKGYYQCTACQKYFDADKTELTDLVIPATGKYLVKITGNHPGGFTLTGAEPEQIVSKGDPAPAPFTVDAGYGYTFDHFEIDGVAQEGNTVALGTVTDDVTVYVVCNYATDELPIINIDTDGAEILSKEDYVTMSFSLENCDTELTGVSGGIRLRGNTTMSFPKKPYRIKFDKKQSLFGLTKAKSWVLLAEYIDPSDLHNYTAFTLRREIDGTVFTPTPNMVNVYLNGEYQGIYTLCEQVQENEGRVGNEKKITVASSNLTDYNFLIVMDVAAEEYVTVTIDEDTQRHFQIKYPEEPDFTSPEQYAKFKSDLQTYLQDLVDAFKNGDVDYIQQTVNINSLLDFMIVDQVMGERDHATKSVYLYFKNGKLNFGPVWDYDWALYTNFGDLQYFTVSEELEYSNIFFQSVRNTPALYQLLKERYTAVGSAALERTIAKVTAFEATIQESVRLDAEKWYPSSDTKFKPYSGYALSQKHTAFLNDFLAKRKEVLDREWLIEE